MSALDTLIERLTDRDEGVQLKDVKFFPGNARRVSPEQFAAAADAFVSSIVNRQATLIEAKDIDGDLEKVSVYAL